MNTFLEAFRPFDNVPDELALAALNTPGRYRVATSAEMLVWAGGAGRMVRLEAAVARELPPQDDASYPAAVAVRSALKAFLLMLTRDNTTLDRNRPEVAQLLGAVVQMGVLTPADLADLDAATPRDPSPAFAALGRDATGEDVAAARAAVTAGLEQQAEHDLAAAGYNRVFQAIEQWKAGTREKPTRAQLNALFAGEAT